jgi:hypothetical protein
MYSLVPVRKVTLIRLEANMQVCKPIVASYMDIIARRLAYLAGP